MTWLKGLNIELPMKSFKDQRDGLLTSHNESYLDIRVHKSVFRALHADIHDSFFEWYYMAEQLEFKYELA